MRAANDMPLKHVCDVNGCQDVKLIITFKCELKFPPPDRLMAATWLEASLELDESVREGPGAAT